MANDGDRIPQHEIEQPAEQLQATHVENLNTNQPSHTSATAIDTAVATAITNESEDTNRRSETSAIISVSTSERRVLVLRGLPYGISADTIRKAFPEDTEIVPPLREVAEACNNMWYLKFDNEDDAKLACVFLNVDLKEIEGYPIRACFKNARPSAHLRQLEDQRSQFELLALSGNFAMSLAGQHHHHIGMIPVATGLAAAANKPEGVMGVNPIVSSPFRPQQHFAMNCGPQPLRPQQFGPAAINSGTANAMFASSFAMKPAMQQSPPSQAQRHLSLADQALSSNGTMTASSLLYSSFPPNVPHAVPIQIPNMYSMDNMAGFGQAALQFQYRPALITTQPGFAQRLPTETVSVPQNFIRRQGSSRRPSQTLSISFESQQPQSHVMDPRARMNSGSAVMFQDGGNILDTFPSRSTENPSPIAAAHIGSASKPIVQGSVFIRTPDEPRKPEMWNHVANNPKRHVEPRVDATLTSGTTMPVNLAFSARPDLLNEVPTPLRTADTKIRSRAEPEKPQRKESRDQVVPENVREKHDGRHPSSSMVEPSHQGQQRRYADQRTRAPSPRQRHRDGSQDTANVMRPPIRPQQDGRRNAAQRPASSRNYPYQSRDDGAHHQQRDGRRDGRNDGYQRVQARHPAEASSRDTRNTFAEKIQSRQQMPSDLSTSRATDRTQQISVVGGPRQQRDPTYQDKRDEEAKQTIPRVASRGVAVAVNTRHQPATPTRRADGVISYAEVLKTSFCSNQASDIAIANSGSNNISQNNIPSSQHPPASTHPDYQLHKPATQYERKAPGNLTGTTAASNSGGGVRPSQQHGSTRSTVDGRTRRNNYQNRPPPNRSGGHGGRGGANGPSTSNSVAR